MIKIKWLYCPICDVLFRLVFVNYTVCLNFVDLFETHELLTLWIDFKSDQVPIIVSDNHHM